ncbi:type II secretion system protein [Vibrio porteresiae]|uniref:Prepilin-type N-terminal cleavage/methylation domain-containing protein n=1 Tax=Vibrio porteresiae DSM 19223 TaxID=1123496 RepID=A0ABZ0QFK4_9VIBR|nr:prepilin-type N-terminal cleavage/methylation domain-containing protein [Vibrio porteresiae]WPC75248.1 prepilin-type N-terminal cleavage/methylation domain-containing protein [Vibrio porteresiae DSM 19223]
MKRQGGFTLIELVVVIVILGILAVTAAPKFLNLQDDAKKSALQGLKGAMDGAAGIVYGKAAVEGKDSGDSVQTLDSGITVLYGYPTATSAGIGASVTGLTSDWTSYANTSTSPASFVATFSSSSITDASGVTGTSCYVSYSQATSAAAASTLVVDSGC